MILTRDGLIVYGSKKEVVFPTFGVWTTLKFKKSHLQMMDLLIWTAKSVLQWEIWLPDWLVGLHFESNTCIFDVAVDTLSPVFGTFQGFRTARMHNVSNIKDSPSSSSSLSHTQTQTSSCYSQRCWSNIGTRVQHSNAVSTSMVWRFEDYHSSHSMWVGSQRY